MYLQTLSWSSYIVIWIECWPSDETWFVLVEYVNTGSTWLFPEKFLTWYFEGFFWNWNLLFHTFSDYSYISCYEWILSEMLSFEMLIEIYKDDQHMNQCHYFIKLLSTGGLNAVFECCQSRVNWHFPLESPKV